MLFDDYVKLDLTLLEPKGPAGVSRAGPSATILLDKCGLVGPLPPPTDADYCCKSRPRGALDDCCNEFWSLAAYVTKGLMPPRVPLRRRPFAPAAARAAADAGLVGGVRLRLFLFARKKL